MRRDEIRGHLVAIAEVDEVFDPFAFRRRWSPDSQRGVDLFNRFDGVAIQLEVVALCRDPEPAQVRFVPDFKEPLNYFVNAVALDAMCHNRLDQLELRPEVARR